MDLSRRQSDAVEPQHFVACLQRQPVGELIFHLQARFASEGHVVGRGCRWIHRLLEADAGRLLGIVDKDADLYLSVERKAAKFPYFPIKAYLDAIKVVRRACSPEGGGKFLLTPSEGA